MSNFICPFSKKICNPSCPFWESEERKSYNSFIPFDITFDDVSEYITPYIQMTSSKWLPAVWSNIQKYKKLYFPADTNNHMAKGKCKKLESMINEDDKID